ncbi:MAG: ABC transporter permease [Lachnospiraceae bacterium]|jgi:teichoic acid transport system permease protein|nr:ABC transporter permease [Lachnospiraceae bacterium]MBQ8006879.1 ABC transporter permease [Lachnospiraceae bacterium]
MTKKKTVIAIVTAVIAALLLYIVLHHNPFANQNEEMIKKIISCVILIAIYSVFILKYDKIVILPVELLQNRQLIWKLAKNDFKTRYAGSYLGIVWAFVQPVITVLLYWFVFTVALPSRAVAVKGDIEIPYILWLIAGIVPWFFFSEALSNGTNALLEYNYLVKKVVFKISILPIIKIISALFVHGFFLLFTVGLFACYGYYPDLYTLQIFYYSACMFIFVLGLCYITCSIIIFFRDLGQIISIALQVGIWATPILWNITTLSPRLRIIFKLNPMNYIVEGYRDSLIDKIWFWENFYSTAYFWILTMCVFAFGAIIFKRLKIHFADVL